MLPGLPGCCKGQVVLAICGLWLLAADSTASAQEVVTLPALTAKVSTPALSREAVVRWALENNPELAALRQQRGIAAAGVIIAQQYPFNPMVESRVEATSGPASAGITNAVLDEQKILLELELRGQANHRRQAAAAALTRTEWEVAFQEVTFTARVLRAFDGVLYRSEKLRLSDERIRLNQLAADQIRKLREQGKLNAADQILILTEVDDSRAQRGFAELALVTAEYELRRATGMGPEAFLLGGDLAGSLPVADSTSLLAMALERRPDLRAKQTAIAEAEAKLRLETSNRYGNPTFGPSFGLDPTRVSSVGVTMIVPLPVLNSRRGEIQQRQAEQMKAVLEFRQVEVQVQQDVLSALARAQRAQATVELYDKTVLPNLRKSLENVEKLFAAGDPGVDVVRVLEIRRNVLKGRDAFLDALWEWAQARVDLVAAVGDLGLALGPDAIPCLPPSR
jgi:cobalt-zinc-cadmium efflux system outer membrane protein